MIHSVFKKSPEETGKNIICKKLNTDFFKSVKDTTRSYTESMNDYVDEDFKSEFARLLIFKNPFITALCVNKYRENSPINIYYLWTDAVDTMSIKDRDFETPAKDPTFKECMSDYQKLVIEHVTKLEDGSREKLWLNGKYTGIISQSNWIKTAKGSISNKVEEEDLDTDEETKAEIQKEIEEENAELNELKDDDRAKREKELFNKHKKKHVYNEIANFKMEMRKDLQDQQFVYIEGNFGRYHRIQLISEKKDPSKKLKLITYYTSELEVVFLFQWDNKPYFFLKKLVDDLINYDATNGASDSKLIKNET